MLTAGKLSDLKPLAQTPECQKVVLVAHKYLAARSAAPLMSRFAAPRGTDCKLPALGAGHQQRLMGKLSAAPHIRTRDLQLLIKCM